MERHFLPAAGCCASWTVLFLRHKHRWIENTIPAAESVFRQKSPISRGGKPISRKFYRLPAARNRFSSDFSPFPPRETVFLRIFPISRRGKAFLKVSDRFPVSFSRYSNPEIGFVSHFCVSEITGSVSCRKMTFTATRTPHNNPPSGGLAVRTRGMFREERVGGFTDCPPSFA